MSINGSHPLETSHPQSQTPHLPGAHMAHQNLRPCWVYLFLPFIPPQPPWFPYGSPSPPGMLLPQSTGCSSASPTPGLLSPRATCVPQVFHMHCSLAPLLVIAHSHPAQSSCPWFYLTFLLSTDHCLTLSYSPSSPSFIGI